MLLSCLEPSKRGKAHSGPKSQKHGLLTASQRELAGAVPCVAGRPPCTLPGACLHVAGAAGFVAAAELAKERTWAKGTFGWQGLCPGQPRGVSHRHCGQPELHGLGTHSVTGSHHGLLSVWPLHPQRQEGQCQGSWPGSWCSVWLSQQWWVGVLRAELPSMWGARRCLVA